MYHWTYHLPLPYRSARLVLPQLAISWSYVENFCATFEPDVARLAPERGEPFATKTLHEPIITVVISYPSSKGHSVAR